jgi:hypothetical protein
MNPIYALCRNNPKLAEIWVTPFAPSIGVERRLQIALGHIVRQRPAEARAFTERARAAITLAADTSKSLSGSRRGHQHAAFGEIQVVAPRDIERAKALWADYKRRRKIR